MDSSTIEPTLCSASHSIPSWLKGTMVRCGRRMDDIGNKDSADSLGFTQKYRFENGKMFYSVCYSESERKAQEMESQRIVAGSFGAASFPDMSAIIFSPFFSTFLTNEDDGNDSPVGDGLYVCTEDNFMHRVDTSGTKSSLTALHTCTVHQLCDDNGDVYSVGSRFGADSAHVFTVTRNPKNRESSWEHTEKIGEIKCSEAMFPTYMHSFGMSQNYLVMFESPIRLDIKKFRNSTTYKDCLAWYDGKDVKVFIMDKKSGEKLPLKIKMDPFFTFHHANTFEKDGCLVLDYCRIEQAGNFDALLIENMKTGEFRHDPTFLPFLTRLVIPLEIPDSAKQGDDLLKSKEWVNGCSAFLQEDGTISLTYKRMCEISLEFPCFNSETMSMKENKYVYGSSAFGISNSKNSAGIVKANLGEERHQVWKTENSDQICGELIFVPEPNGMEEDGGVLIVPVMTMSDEHRPFVLILDARTVEEIGRYTID